VTGKTTPEHFVVLLFSPFVTITTVRISLGGDSFYLHCLIYRNMVGLRVWSGAPVIGLNPPPPAVLILLTVPMPLCVPQMYDFVVSYCVGDTFVCVPSCFLVYGKYFPFASSFISLIYPTSPLLRISYHIPLCPLTLWPFYSIIYFFSLISLSVKNYFLLCNVIVISLSVFCLVPSPDFFLFWVPWVPCRWFLLLGRVGVTFIERRLSLLILFIIF
jgi:hypothetical protein